MRGTSRQEILYCLKHELLFVTLPELATLTIRVAFRLEHSM